MNTRCFSLILLALWPVSVTLAAPAGLPGVASAMTSQISAGEVPGAVTVVVKNGDAGPEILDITAVGMADIASGRAMTPDTLFWIASMTKPVTATAVLMLQDEGKLSVADPVAKYLPEFAALKTPSGKPADLTITQILTHTSGLAEAGLAASMKAVTLADLVPAWLSGPMQYEPGSRWSYTQSGINAAARIVEVVSGKRFDAFLQERIFDPLGMKDTTFYPTEAQRARLVTGYRKNKETGAFEAVQPWLDPATRNRPPLGNGGLFSTGPDYAAFCQMLMAGGTWKGRSYLSAEALNFITTPQTGELPCGFFQGGTWGNYGTNYGWGLGTCILRTPHPGVAEMLSPGSYGHGGAWGTQVWIDPRKGVACILMVQRSDFPNSDGSDVRRAFQQAVMTSLAGGS